ncbi:hypothetical protein SSX86_010899 [Deinandra increscens subsp. villosa]|uniref:BED-type domain-containing protein n=1 Tax=Deinandra increscens subsp. villosa TaxID=3103831 RepID=A0AAP0H3M8_9ASTR
MGREPDPGWAHGTHVQGTKNSVLCKFCGFKSTGGITRHKHHLAWDSSEVSKCPKVPPDVKQFFKELFEKSNQAKEAENRIPHFDDVVDLEEDDEDEIPSFNEGHHIGKKGGHLVGSVQHKEVQKKLRLEAVQLFCRWLYDAGLPFNSLKYDSLGPAIEAIGRYGCGMKPPSYHEVRVPMLKLEVEHTRKILEENEVEKATYGCSLMADGWRDRRGRALINFLVNTPRGSMFIESVDASSYSHTGDNMFKLFDQFIQKVGSESVIRIVTDSASNNVSAGKLVEAKYPHIYWTPCAAHCIDLMFEDIFKLSHLKIALEKAITVNTYIYNRTLLLNMMREFTGQKDMVRPAKTRFATAFITLSCFKANKKALRKMFTSSEWTNSKFAKEVGGRQTENTILFPAFWNNVNVAVKVGGPLLGVLRLVDGERKPPMGYIYEAMDRAKEMIAASFKNKEEKYKAIFDIIDKRWDCQLHRPLHAAGYYLNPSLYYNNPRVEDDDEVVSGLYSCIEKLALNEDEQLRIHTGLPTYRGAEKVFGYPIAKKMRAKLAPAEWWKQYGSSAPTLRKFAIKVLSLTCSSSGCERNWSVFEHLHSKKRTRLDQKKLNDLVYIKYNRALRRRYNMRDTIDPIILDDGNIQDPNEWLAGVLEDEDEENAPVHEGEDLTYGHVADATGAGEPSYNTRRATASQRGANTSTSSSRPRRRLLDEDVGDVDGEENDVMAYKDFVVTSDGDNDDDDGEPGYEDLDDD